MDANSIPDQLATAIGSGLINGESNQTPFTLKRYSSAGSLSVANTGSPATTIALEDNTDQTSPNSRSPWARQVTVTDPIIVRTSGDSKARRGPGYVVWLCTIELQDTAAAPIKVRRRYSDFVALRSQLCIAFPHHGRLNIPVLPPKSYVSKFRTPFLEKRRRGLEYFLASIVLNPQLYTHQVAILRAV